MTGDRRRETGDRPDAPTRPPSAVPGRQMTEDQLGDCVREACEVLGWRFLWCRRLESSSAGILDLQLIPLRHQDRRHTLHRELKGYDRNGRLGSLTPEQAETIEALNAAGDDARKWAPEDWTSGQIQEELK